MIYKSNYIFWGKLFSMIIAPYFKLLNLFRKKYNLKLINIKTILVTEYHRIGDVIIIAPILQSIKSKFPNAEIVLICNESSKELAEELKLADKVYGISAPWTNWSWSFLEWCKIRNFSKTLQSLDIDLAIDFKGDLRNSWFLWNTHPKLSFGYNTTGGDYFFTNVYTMNQNDHQYSRASKLIKEFDCSIKREKNKYHSALNGFIVIHPGASDLMRSWSDTYWEELVSLLIRRFKVSIVVTKDFSDLISNLKTKKLDIEYFEGSLVNFYKYISNQKCLIATDSMAGHLASYVGIPVITIYGSQNPDLTKPKNEYGKVIKPEKQCDHNRKHWRLCKLCIESISPKRVYDTVLKHVLYIERNL